MSSSSGTLSPRSSPEPLKSSKKRKIDVPEIEVDISLPEPPSKKAKRALKKGKVLPPKANSDDDEPTTTTSSGKATTDGAAKKERSPYGVWIGNLRFTVTRDDLRAWLVENSGGAIAADAITRVHLPASKTAPKHAAFENRGFAYVDFATYEATVAAIALSETEWHRRKLLIKDAKSYEGRPAVKKEEEGKEEAEPEQPVSTSRKVFVGNLGFQTTEEDVKELFSKCGEIEWVKVATFEDSGKCKGYGWVKFAEAAAADWAVKGFVKIKEVEETEEDFIDEEEAKKEEESSSSSSSSDEDSDASSGSDADSDADSDSDSSSGSGSNSSSSEDEEEEEKSKPAPAKKTQKPAPVPEKKVKMRKWWVNTLHGRRLKIEHAEDDQTRYKKRFKKNPDAQKSNGGGGGEGAPRGKFNKPREGGRGPRKDPSDFSKNNVDITVARLTGAPVKSEGKKTTFE
ncbi:Nucleolar protein 13 [Gnomoniopsis smithogilvyi]|uniref:Nucleolar protein 13 n=1 Tax=Gnomoniopsis smithogilvyi TaxID=1191159 RepID=A0A9W8Z0G5_9PEZI|nr:Nucleolar protein 13 [Gnomoniopsis smithogilvyi]